MSVLKTMFEQLISPEQRRLAATVDENGGVKALRNNDKMLLELEKTSSMALSAPGAEGRRALWAKPSNADPDADELRTDIFEDPDAAVEKNKAVYFRKFEMQELQIIDELRSDMQRETDRAINDLTFVVHREGDHVINELKNGPHNRIRDRVSYVFYPPLKRVLISWRPLQTIHEIWVEMVDIIASNETL